MYDQLSAYESVPESVHYVTKFIDGLQPAVRVMVALHQPQDLDAAYELTLLHETMTATSAQIGSSARRQQYNTSASSIKHPTTKPADDRRGNTESHRQVSGEDKWSALRAYRKAKGLCFMCGEKWSRDHQCKQLVSLHVVQEMVEFFQCSAMDESVTDEEEEVNLMAISEAAEGKTAHSKAFQLTITLNG